MKGSEASLGRPAAGQARRVTAHRVGPDVDESVPEALAVEEPLAIRVALPDIQPVQVAVTMRTPGADHELAVGWLLAEGILRSRRDVLDVSWCVRDDAVPEQHFNAVTVTLAGSRLPDLTSLERHGLVSSACGVCGTASLQAMEDRGLGVVDSDIEVTTELLASLPDLLRRDQPTFTTTGGLHAAARVGVSDGTLRDAREDIGRHNALDKVVGAALLDGVLPLRDEVLVLSGRASYELLQKAVVAGAPVVAAIGAPSSLAVDVAESFGITLIGFLRPDRANVYTHADRVRASRGQSGPVPIGAIT